MRTYSVVLSKKWDGINMVVGARSRSEAIKYAKKEFGEKSLAQLEDVECTHIKNLESHKTGVHVSYYFGN